MIYLAIRINHDLIIADTHFQRSQQCIVENYFVDKSSQHFENMDEAHVRPRAKGVVQPTIIDTPLTLTLSPVA